MFSVMLLSAVLGVAPFEVDCQGDCVACLKACVSVKVTTKVKSTGHGRLDKYRGVRRFHVRRPLKRTAVRTRTFTQKIKHRVRT